MHPVFHESRHLQTSPVVFAPTGFDGSIAIDSAICSPVHETNTVVPQLSTRCSDSWATVSHNDSTQVASNNDVVVRIGQPNIGNAMEVSQTISDIDNGCVNGSLGGTCQPNEGTTSMETAPNNSPYQRLGAASCSEWTESISVQTGRQDCVDSDGQFNSHQLYQQGRGNQVSTAVSDHLEHLQLVHRAQNPVASCSYSGQEESIGRQIVQTDVVSHRVGTQRSSSAAAVSALAPTHVGSVCHSSEQETSSVLFTIPSQTSRTSGCSVNELGQSIRLCFSSPSHSQSGSSEGGFGEGSADLDRATMDQEGVVSPSPGSDHRYSLSPSSSEEHCDSGTGTSPSSQPGRTLTRGMVGKRNTLIAQGLSQGAAATCIAAKSTGTQKNYQSGWNSFGSWCASKDIDPDESSVAMIVDYLYDLLQSGKSFYTARARISAIAFFHPGRTFRGSLGTHPTIQSFISGAKRKFPPLRDKIPSWDLPTVLKALMGHPFEPLQELSLAQLTYKTIFLVAVCSARRIGEINALDCRPPYCSMGQGGIVLKTHSSFRPKVPTIANMEKSLEFAPYGIDDEGSDLPERTLCVCRALECYITATRDIRRTNQLFVTFKAGDQGRAASKITMAGWLKTVIQNCYEVQNLPIPRGVKAHSARHASTSWAELRAISILDICQQASWASSNTFVKHYKLDLSQSVSSRHARAVLDAHAPS